LVVRARWVRLMAVTLAASWGALVPRAAGAPDVGGDAASVVALSVHRRAGVTSLELSNGVRVHARAMVGQPDVLISVLLAGTELRELPSERGMTGLIAASLQEPSGSWTARATPEGLVLRARCEPADLASTLRALVATLDRPELDAVRFELARAERVALAGQSSAQRQVAGAMLGLIAPGAEGALGPPTAEALAALTVERARVVAGDLAGVSAVDVAIVGQVQVQDALREARAVLGAVRARVRDRLDERRGIEREPGKDVEVVGRLPAGQVMVSVSVPAASLAALRQSRAGLIAAVLMEGELRASARQAGVDAMLVVASPLPGRVYPKLGLCVGTMLVRVEPELAQQTGRKLAASVRERLTQVAARGPEAEALKAARARVVREAQQRLGEREYWGGALPAAWFLGVHIDELGEAPEVLATLSIDEVAHEVSAWGRPGAVTTVVLWPGPAAARGRVGGGGAAGGGGGDDGGESDRVPTAEPGAGGVPRPGVSIP